MGIDQSINNTGVCIIPQEGDWLEAPIYYLIKGSKKLKSIKSPHDRVYIIPYEKEELKSKENNYSEEERIKSNNIQKICDIIQGLVNNYRPSQVNLEGVAYGAKGQGLLDLCMLQGCIRMAIMRENTRFFAISPAEVKKYATGNGNASKSLIIEKWKEYDNLGIEDGKIDDLADAFFIANYK